MIHLPVCAGGLLVAISCLASGLAYGDSDLLPKPGDRVRLVGAVAPGRTTGTLVSIDDQSISLLPDKSEQRVTIARDSITRLEALVGRKRCTVKGAIVGALAGAAVMALYFSGNNDLSQNNGTGDVIGGFAFFLLPPAGVGALVGTGIQQDRWVSIVPSGRGAREGRVNVGFTIRF